MAASNFEDKRVLIIEDDHEMLDLIDSVVRGLGVINIDRASNGERAWRHIRECESYDLILFDWVMPVVDGFMILRRFRKRDPNAIVLMVTSKNTAEDFQMAKDVGINGYILKPFTIAQLSTKVRELLR